MPGTSSQLAEPSSGIMPLPRGGGGRWGLGGGGWGGAGFSILRARDSPGRLQKDIKPAIVEVLGTQGQHGLRVDVQRRSALESLECRV